MIGCVIYGIGSFLTAISHELWLLLLGWSVLEGLGAALIMPAVVALVASNFEPSDRPRVYGLVASAAAIAVAVGPLVGGLFTTYASWRWVFVGEVLIVVCLLALTSRLADTPPEAGVRLDPVGTLLSAAGLALVVYGVIRTGTWGFVVPKPDAPQWLGASLCLWLMLGGAVVLAGFIAWEGWRVHRGRAVLVDPAMLRVPRLQGGLISFFFQFFLQAGLFFVVPLFLSIALGLSAVATGVRLLPLSLALLFSAALVPRLFRGASPRRIVRVGFALVFLGLLILLLALDQGSGPEVVTVPLLLVGIGIGALASQLGAITVSAVPDEQSGEVGGLQYTVTNLGASLGTALAGAVLISVLTTTFLTGISNDPAVSQELSSKAQVELSAGIPFVSDAQLQSALQAAGVPSSTAQAVTDQNAASRINGLRASLALLALMALLALAMTRRLPDTPLGVKEVAEAQAGTLARPPPA
jgi:MFS family permease